MPGQPEPVPATPAADAAGPDVSGAVTPETPPAGTPEQAPAYITQSGLAEYLQANGYVPERVVQSRIDKAVAAVRRQVTGSPEDRARALAVKYGVPEAQLGAFLEEANKQELLRPDAQDEGAEQQAGQAGTAGDMTAFWAEWNPRLYEAGLRTGDPELANLTDPHKFKSAQAYANAVAWYGAQASARRAAAEKATAQPTPGAPAAAPAMFPKGGGGPSVNDNPSREQARNAFYRERN